MNWTSYGVRPMPESEPARSGLPLFEQFYLNLFFKIDCSIRSDKSALAEFEASSRDILQVVDSNDLGVLSQEILLPRLQGLQDSSRNWSVLMVLDHLATVNKAIMDTIRSLRSGSHPFEEIALANFQPDENAGADAIEKFRETNRRYWSFAKSHQPLRTGLTHLHPWFGELDGHAWHCLAAAHQKIHRRQIYKILATIGIA